MKDELKKLVVADRFVFVRIKRCSKLVLVVKRNIVIENIVIENIVVVIYKKNSSFLKKINKIVNMWKSLLFKIYFVKI